MGLELLPEPDDQQLHLFEPHRFQYPKVVPILRLVVPEIPCEIEADNVIQLFPPEWPEAA